MRDNECICKRKSFCFDEAQEKENPIFFRPWREIFVNGNVRKLTFEKSVEFRELLIKSYKVQNYNLIEVLFVSVNERAHFIIEKTSHILKNN